MKLLGTNITEKTKSEGGLDREFVAVRQRTEVTVKTTCTKSIT